MEHGTWSAEEKKEYLQKVLTVEKERLAKFADVGQENKFFFQDISFEKAMLTWKTNSNDQTKISLESAKNVLENISDENWTREMIEEKLLEAAGDRRGDLLWPLRVALTDAQKSPSPFECGWVLGKVESIKRLESAIKML